MQLYIVDSNFFIQAHRSTYPFDVAPSFWNKIKQIASDGKIISIDKVKNEIYRQEDALKKWCKNNLPDGFFKNTNEAVYSYSKVVNWAYSKRRHYLQKALDEFLDADEADAWLVAYAHKNNDIIVTYEVSEPESRKKIKIPDVCSAFDVDYVNTIEMFRRLGERF